MSDRCQPNRDQLSIKVALGGFPNVPFYLIRYFVFGRQDSKLHSAIYNPGKLLAQAPRMKTQ
jgi:hypothetical protein